MEVGFKVPNVEFLFREGDEAPTDGGCPIGGDWVSKVSDDIFANKRVVIFSLPGAFTPTCSSQQVPGFEKLYYKIRDYDVDEIYVVSVNDAFVMNAWADSLGIKNIKVLPDGNGDFTGAMGMLVEKRNLGFGPRSWRYAAVINDGVVEQWFEEPGARDNADDDPYGETSPENVLKSLS